LTDALLGPRLKLDRAREHLDDLRREVDEFLATEPYGVAAEDEPEVHQRVYRVARYTDPPTHLALIIGDVVHNARCALDHFAQVAAAQGAGRPLTDKESRRIQFPLEPTPGRFKRQVKDGRLLHVDPSLVGWIEALQPYEQGLPLRGWIHPLGILRHLSNIDKHRRLHVLGMVVTIDGLDAFVSIPGLTLTPMLGPETLEIGTELLRANLPDPIPDGMVEPDFSFGVGVETGARGAIETLQSVIHCIDERFLSKGQFPLVR
jgi:hypothetical protein